MRSLPCRNQRRFRHGFLGHIGDFFSLQLAQAPLADLRAGEYAVTGKATGRFEKEIGFPGGERVEVFRCQEMSLGHMGAQQGALIGKNPELPIPIRQGEKFEQALVAARRIGKRIGRDIHGAMSNKPRATAQTLRPPRKSRYSG